MDNINSSPEQRIKRYKQRLARLKSDRDTWLTSWRDIAENVYPWLERRLKDNADYKLDNCTPRLEHSAQAWAINVLAAGLTSGMTPQSRKWFKLSFPNAGSNMASAELRRSTNQIDNRSSYRYLRFVRGLFRS